ncbi:MAG: indolepyruvate ferredoxin oxidoreductase family protein [Ilumatobacteraceae bacterium]
MGVLEKEFHDGVVVIRMNRPDKLNAMNTELLVALAEAWTEFRDTPEQQIAILTGNGRGFCAGEDLVEAAERGTPGFAPGLPHDPFWEGELLKPVIACVNGWAMGGGFIQAFHCDFRIASRNAIFEISEARHWLLGAYQFGFRDTLPWTIATELALGFRMDAERAYQVGFLNRLVDEPEDLLPAAFEMCDHMRAIPPASLKNTLEIAKRLRPAIPADVVARGVELSASGGNYDDVMEARHAFAEKRKPRFTAVSSAPGTRRRPTMSTTAGIDRDYRLEDRFERERGRVYLTGWDALVRLPLMQRQRDEAAGLNTAGYVSGYPGSPLGGLDSLFRAQREMLAARHIHFEPGLNEDIAATAISGTQHLGVGPVTSRYDGIFGLWYGKGPGVERSTDAMRTASVRGTSRTGGVLALAGDDHHARSTVTAQQSETLFVHMHMPVFNPATVQEYLDFGLAGWAVSRLTSSWVGMICLNDTADSAATVDIDPSRPRLEVPGDVVIPPTLGDVRVGGLGGALAIEEEIRTLRYPAAQVFVRHNGLDRVTLPSTRRGRGRGIGIVTAGKGALDVDEAMAQLGIGRERAGELGLSVLKLAMTFPLDPQIVIDFADGLDEVLVIEPKHPIIEDQVARVLRRLPADRRPDVVGKTDEHGAPLIPEFGGLDATQVAGFIRARIERRSGDAELVASLRPRHGLTVLSASSAPVATEELVPHDDEHTDLVRAAGFCSGCPHNTGTKVPDGSFAIGGTGCHGMAIALAAPGRPTFMGTHMGGEGALWIGLAPFVDQRHTFQNMGDGTYSHSGALAIRAAVAAGTTMTFKVLLNGYISMTGGQSIPGGLTAQMLAAQLLADGVRKVVVATDDLSHYEGTAPFPAGVDVVERDALLRVQEELRGLDGVTALVYDQACAAELRRERKRGNAVDPDKRVFIHQTVCEGCGDCNVQSNCISVEPLATELGRKRTINQSTCNKDFSCVDGYCPSFVTLTGARPRQRGRHGAGATALFAGLPEPATVEATEPYNILVGGIGGGGVLTIGGLLGMAAHLEGKTATVLNESGLAQKNGAVQSHIRVLDQPGAQLTPRIDVRAADVVIGADIVVISGAGTVATMARGRTWAIVNDDVRPTVAFSRDGNLDLSSAPMSRLLQRATGDQVELLDANHLALVLMGDSIYANLLLLGYALQRGRLPVSAPALERAVELNGVAVANNQEALQWGRLAAHDLDAVLAVVGDRQAPDAGVAAMSLDELIAHRRAFLAGYQDQRYAQRYEQRVRKVAATECERVPGHDELARAVAENLFKLMAYKDEYEVARLYADPAFVRELHEAFEGDFTFKVNLAPQLFNRRDRATGRARKWEVPSRVAMPAFKVLATGRRLRGTPFDLFGRTAHRRAERSRIDEYLTMLDEVCGCVDAGTHDLAVQLAALPDAIRGYDRVKDASAAQAKEKELLLLAELRQRSPRPALG